ncbi:hypothetical protein [Bradyrhizobium sp. 157]|nr:hypothetical protein [Bradyrhizobium sp. 157]
MAESRRTAAKSRRGKFPTITAGSTINNDSITVTPISRHTQCA